MVAPGSSVPIRHPPRVAEGPEDPAAPICSSGRQGIVDPSRACWAIHVTHLGAQPSPLAALSLRHSGTGNGVACRLFEGFSDSTIRTIGVLEIVAAVGLILPWLLDIATALTPLAAVGVVAIQIGASRRAVIRSHRKIRDGIL
jgi:hypothetical protein